MVDDDGYRQYCEPPLYRALEAFWELAGEEVSPCRYPVWLWYSVLQEQPDLLEHRWHLPSREVLAFARLLVTQPLGRAGTGWSSQALYVISNPEEKVSIASDFAELHLALEVVLLYWWLGRYPLPQPETVSLMGSQFWRCPGARTASAHNHRSIVPMHMLLEGLNEPRCQLAHRGERELAVRLVDSNDRQEVGLTSEAMAVLRHLAELCLQHNLRPTPIHLSWAALTCPELLQAWPARLSALTQTFERECLGSLPSGGCLKVATQQLVWDDQVLLHPSSTYDEAENLLGKGRVGLWIPRPDGWLRVRFDQSLLHSIQWKPELD